MSHSETEPYQQAYKTAINLATSSNTGSVGSFHKLAAPTITMIEALPPPQQATILALPHVVSALAQNGQCIRTITAIEKFSPDQQAEALSAPFALCNLINGVIMHAGLITRVFIMLEKLNPGQLTKVLSSPFALAQLIDAGQTDNVVQLMRKLSPGQKRTVSFAPHLIFDGKNRTEKPALSLLEPDVAGTFLAKLGLAPTMESKKVWQVDHFALRFQ